MFDLLLHSCVFIVVLVSTIQHFRLKRLPNVLGIDPLLGALLIQGGGALANRIANGSPPSVPDVFTPAVREGQRSRSRIEEMLNRRLSDLNTNLAARGATGSGGARDRETLMNTASSAFADIDASIADLITTAGNRQRELEFGDARSRFGARQQGISDLTNAAGTIFSLRNITDPSLENTTSGLTPSTPTPTQQLPLLSQSPEAVRRTNDALNTSPVRLTPTVDPLTGRITFDI